MTSPFPSRDNIFIGILQGYGLWFPRCGLICSPFLGGLLTYYVFEVKKDFFLCVERVAWAAPLDCIQVTHLLGDGRPDLGLCQIGHYNIFLGYNQIKMDPMDVPKNAFMTSEYK